MLLTNACIFFEMEPNAHFKASSGRPSNVSDFMHTNSVFNKNIATWRFSTINR